MDASMMPVTYARMQADQSALRNQRTQASIKEEHMLAPIHNNASVCSLACIQLIPQGGAPFNICHHLRYKQGEEQLNRLN
jgi:hypothetical protein